MSRADPLPASEAVAIKCPTCHATGEIIVDAGPVRPSAGFSFDMHKVPTCETCCVPAGLVLPPLRDGFTFDVGPDAPRDELQTRLDAARAVRLLAARELEPIRRWS